MPYKVEDVYHVWTYDGSPNPVVLMMKTLSEKEAITEGERLKKTKKHRFIKINRGDQDIWSCETDAPDRPVLIHYKSGPGWRGF
ncbi:hypothetical protein O3U67_03405 [Brevundimonas diminuta]|uniref:hypothetical protein n=1 Tax=Brevundimonas diminuta TaxID=293 RepID=UPI0022AE8C71|nr:hypothetical protein [Brevundimonas diminuta]MCZ4107120.1 hypothetical protein [Brevundimonas diminuta]